MIASRLEPRFLLSRGITKIPDLLVFKTKDTRFCHQQAVPALLRPNPPANMEKVCDAAELIRSQSRGSWWYWLNWLGSGGLFQKTLAAISCSFILLATWMWCLPFCFWIWQTWTNIISLIQNCWNISLAGSWALELEVLSLCLQETTGLEFESRLQMYSWPSKNCCCLRVLQFSGWNFTQFDFWGDWTFEYVNS